MPTMMWGEAVRHAIYILNRLPTKALAEEIPYEAWLGTKPRLDHIRVFGCLAHEKVQSNGLIKLDDMSVDMVYIGKELGTKANRPYNPNTGRLHVIHDMIFEEGKGWNLEHHETRGNNSPDTFIIIAAQDGIQKDGKMDPPSPRKPNTLNSSTDGSGYEGYNYVF